MIQSLHHVTATVAEAPADVDFYARILGLRLVKKTVNFDNHGVYHFYYGNGTGLPSTLMTTFPYARQGVPDGVKGAGQIIVTSFSIPPGSLWFWRERLEAEGLRPTEDDDRFGAGSLTVEDPSGLVIELLEGSGDERSPWIAEGVDPEAAIRGVHGVTIMVRSGDRSVRFLEDVLGWRVLDRAGSRTRLGVGAGGPGSVIEVVESTNAPAAVNGLGTVHHVAMAVSGDDEQLAFREKLVELGHQVTPVRDRQYFRSIYFREPGGILYEIATAGPGFLIDEDPDTLGTALKLPAWEEGRRSEIEAALPRVRHPDPKG